MGSPILRPSPVRPYLFRARVEYLYQGARDAPAGHCTVNEYPWRAAPINLCRRAAGIRATCPAPSGPGSCTATTRRFLRRSVRGRPARAPENRP